jgi:hypothetical protein
MVVRAFGRGYRSAVKDLLGLHKINPVLDEILICFGPIPLKPHS